MITRYLSTLAVFGLAALSPCGAQTVSTVSPSSLDGSAASEFQVAGSGLGGVVSASIQAPGAAPIALQIAAQSAASLTLRGNLALAPADDYALTLDSVVFPSALEVYHAPSSTVGGYSTTTDTLPVYSGFTYSNSEMLFLKEELGAGGTIDALTFALGSGSTAPAGSVLLRAKSTALSEFSGDMLDASGWTDLYDGPMPALDGGNLKIDFALTGFAAYDGTQNLLVSLVIDGTANTGGTHRVFDGGANRHRIGRALSTATLPRNWTGSSPGFRALSTTLPAVTFHFDEVPVTADFSVVSTAVTTGQSVAFTNASSANATTFEWDFDRDGVVDSTDANPTYAYSVAGTYSISLRAAQGHASDARVREAYISVTGASGVPEAFEID